MPDEEEQHAAEESLRQDIAEDTPELAGKNPICVRSYWLCPSCGANISVDLLTTGTARQSHACWCNSCNVRMGITLTPETSDFGDVALRYFGKEST
jgi:hypothetical protein